MLVDRVRFLRIYYWLNLQAIYHTLRLLFHQAIMGNLIWLTLKHLLTRLEMIYWTLLFALKHSLSQTDRFFSCSIVHLRGLQILLFDPLILTGLHLEPLRAFSSCLNLLSLIILLINSFSSLKLGSRYLNAFFRSNQLSRYKCSISSAMAF